MRFFPHRRFVAWLALALALAAAPLAQAQQLVGRIVASVNDDAITDYDLSARVAMLAASAGRQSFTDAERDRIRRQALRELIDESLQIQEATRLGIEVSDQEVGAGIERIERRNRMQPGGLLQELTRTGVPIETLLDQIKATLLWRKVLRLRVLPQVRVAGEEVDDALERIRDAGGGEVVRAAEIFLPIDRPEDREPAIQLARRLAEQASSSAAFAELAARHSRAPTAAVGGDLGELQPGQLSEALENALSGLAPGQTSEPIETQTGVYVMHLISRRSIDTGAPDQAVVTIARAFLPITPSRTQAEAEATLTQALGGLDGCDAFERAAAGLGERQPARVVDARIGDLPPILRDAVADLEAGNQTEPLAIGDGVAKMMLCRRATAGAALPSAERISETIQTQRAERRAERYLRDLRRLAFIEIRG